MHYSLVSREVIADSLECAVQGHAFDALVCIPNCDKIVPGMLLGALVAPQSETAGSAIGGVIGLAAVLIGLTATEKKRSQSGEYAPKLLRVISAADALKS